jgi:two-component system, LytTR family, sensor histidine kinase AlgZ
MHPILARRGRLSLYLLAWVPFAAMLVGLFRVAGGMAWGEAAALGTPLAAVYALMCLAAAYPCRSVPLSAATLSRIVGGQAVAAALSTALWFILATNWVLVLQQVPAWAGLSDRFAPAIPAFLVAGVVLYAMAAALHYLVLAFEAARELERRQLELSLLAREAELKALRTQLDPHFMFNALNSISALVGSDPAGARRMCSSLADLLRATMRLADRATVSLAEELELVDAYLDIEATRFADRLRVERHLEPGVERLPVPPLLLQPLAENAVRHGISRLVAGGTVRLEARRDGADLLLAVTNPTSDTAPPTPGNGIGLANVRARVEALPGGRGSVATRSGGGSFRVELRVPVSPAAELDAARGGAVPQLSTAGGAPTQ